MISITLFSLVIFTVLVAVIHVIYALKHRHGAYSPVADRIVKEIAEKLSWSRGSKITIRYILFKELFRTGLFMGYFVLVNIITSLLELFNIETIYIGMSYLKEIDLVIVVIAISGTLIPLVMGNYVQSWLHTGTHTYESALWTLSMAQMISMYISIGIVFANNGYEVTSFIVIVISLLACTFVFWLQWFLWSFIRYYIWNTLTSAFKNSKLQA